MKLKWILMSLLLSVFSIITVAQPAKSASWFVGLDLDVAFSPYNATMTVDNLSEAPPPYNLLYEFGRPIGIFTF